MGLRDGVRKWWTREHEIAMEIIDGQLWARVGDGEPFLVEDSAPHVMEAISNLESGIHRGTFHKERWPTRLRRRLSRAGD